jgi:hypothetical protein
MKIYLPTYWGDIALEKKDAESSTLKTAKLTAGEEVVVRDFLKKMKVPEGMKLYPRTYAIPKPVSKAHPVLTACLKKGKPTITAVRIEAIEEVADVKEAEEKGAKTAVTTSAPRRGCPMPVYDPTLEKEIRATRVLREFLSPTQLADFNRLGAFVVVGRDTRRMYLLSHRWSKRAAEGGIVFDMTRSRRICSEPCAMPPSEEILSLMVALSCRGREMEWLGKQDPGVVLQ